MSTPIKSLSLACRVVMDMHALNNEGSESNRLMTRQVGIVTPVQQEDGSNGYGRFTVNAISGDMNKHIFADVFRNIALDLDLPVCPACQALDPARMMGNEWFFKPIEDKENDEFWDTVKVGKKSERVINGGRVTDRLLTCTVDDVCGIMITAGTSIKRKSAIEFGWTVGLPDITEVEEFIHARHAINRVTGSMTSEERQRNIGQMVFNRPASSGIYALVAHLDVAAIGFNSYSQEYPSEAYGIKIDRPERLRAALMALAQAVLHPKGALTSTQLPHVVDVEGFVSTSSSAAAAPLISPLADGYIERGEDIAQLLNRLHGENAVRVQPFVGSDGLLNELADIVETAEPGQYRRQ